MKKFYRSIFVLLLVLLIGFVWAMSKLFTSETHGINAADFDDRQLGDLHQKATGQALGKKDGAQPNIIVILADDLGYGDVGSYGGSVIKTPNMDQLAAEGMQFNNAYSSAPVCSPSRAGLLTGRYPVRSGIMSAMQAAGDSFMRRASVKVGAGMSNLGAIDLRGGENMVNGLPLVELTVAEMLQDSGYQTAAFGKWHLGDFTQWPRYHPSKHGFDHFVGFNMSNDDWPVAFYRNQEKKIADIGLDQEKYTGLFTDEAVKFIEKSAQTPFFIYLAHKDPHQPFIPSKEFAGKSEGGPYGDAVSEFDWSIGQITKTLQRLNIADNTIVIVTSDNGPWYEGSSGGLRGRKGQSYEGGFRVPLVVWWPGKIPSGVIEKTPVMNIDFLPTFAELGGVELPSDRAIDGRSLAPLIFEQPHKIAERPLYFFHDYDVEAARIGQWKYIANNSHYVWPMPLDKPDSYAGKMLSSRDYTPPNSDQSVPTLGTWPLLYNLDRDPMESYNVAKSNPKQVKYMADTLAKWRSKFYANPRNIEGIGR